MCDRKIKNKHITRYQKYVYSNKSRYSRFTNIDKFDLCPRCEKFLNKMMIKMKEKIKESEQMNKEDYFKYYINGSDHYLIPKDVFDELFDEMVNWREENKELKKKLEDTNKENKILRENAEYNDKVVDKVNWENLKLKEENKQLYNTIEELSQYEDIIEKQGWFWLVERTNQNERKMERYKRL